MLRSLFVSVLGAVCLLGCSDGGGRADDGASTTAAALSDSDEQTAQLDGLRARVAQDFRDAPSLRGVDVALEARRMRGDRRHVLIVAHIVKRTADGHLAELADADFRGSAHEEAIADGLFDGPEVTALLEKAGNTWTVMRTGTGEMAREAYVVGPTDVAWATWDADFGVPKSWF